MYIYVYIYIYIYVYISLSLFSQIIKFYKHDWYKDLLSTITDCIFKKFQFLIDSLVKPFQFCLTKSFFFRRLPRFS